MQGFLKLPELLLGECFLVMITLILLVLALPRASLSKLQKIVLHHDNFTHRSGLSDTRNTSIRFITPLKRIRTPLGAFFYAPSI